MTNDPSNPNGPLQRSGIRISMVRRDSEQFPDGDDALLLLVQARDQCAMAQLFDRYGSLVYSIAFRVLKDSASAEDVMQEIFIRVWENPQAYVSGRGSLAAWLAVMARNRAVDILRRRKPADPVEEVVLAALGNLAADAERNIMFERIRGLLGQLPNDQRYSVELAFFEGLTHSEIAERTNVPLGTVKTRIRTALLFLREAVQV